MKRKKNTGRLVLAAAAAAAASLISGCALSALTAENVMEPPQPFGDGAAIQAVLEEALGPQITLRYPRSGEYRSAVVRADVDNDSNEEAIVFYRQATENTGAHMALLDINEEEEWALIGEYSGSEVKFLLVSSYSMELLTAAVPPSMYIRVAPRSSICFITLSGTELPLTSRMGASRAYASGAPARASG